MDKQVIFDGVVKALQEILTAKNDLGGSSKIDWDTDIYNDLGLDSLELLDLLSALEERFGVNPDQYEANDKRTVSQIVEYTTHLIDDASKGREG